jgi:hypothetical protein
MLERRGLGLTGQPLADVVLARTSAAQLVELVGALYAEFRPDDEAGADELKIALKRADKLREQRNKIVHAAWVLSTPDEQELTHDIAWSLIVGRSRRSGQTLEERSLHPEDLDALTLEATTLQVYAVRLCHSVNQSGLPLAEQLRRPV